MLRLVTCDRLQDRVRSLEPRSVEVGRGVLGERLLVKGGLKVKRKYNENVSSAAWFFREEIAHLEVLEGEREVENNGVRGAGGDRLPLSKARLAGNLQQKKSEVRKELPATKKKDDERCCAS